MVTYTLVKNNNLSTLTKNYSSAPYAYTPTPITPKTRFKYVSGGSSSGSSRSSGSSSSGLSSSIPAAPTNLLTNKSLETITKDYSDPNTQQSYKPTLDTSLNKNQLDTFTTSRPTGTKVRTESAGSLLEKGAFGSVLRLEDEDIQPFTNQGLDLGLAIRKIGLGIASIPAEFGQLIGSNITQKGLGLKTGFKEDEQFIYTGGSGRQGIKEIYGFDKAITKTDEGFKKDPIGTGIDIGLKTLGLIPLATAGTKVLSRGIVKAGTFFSQYIPAEKIVSPEVLSGQTPFPYVRNVKDAQKVFNKGQFNTIDDAPVIFHATTSSQIPFVGRNTVITTGRGIEKAVDVPAKYYSTKGVSTYFLRTGKQPLSLDYSLPSRIIPKIIPDSPKIQMLSQTPKRIPAAFRTSLKKAQSFFGKNPATKAITNSKQLNKAVASSKYADDGIAYYTAALEKGLKKEAEAGLTVGSKVIRTGLNTIPQKLFGFSKYTKINGRVIPIYQETTTQVVKIIPKNKIVQTIKTITTPRTIVSSSGSTGSSSKAVLSSQNIVAASKIINSLKQPTSTSKIVSSKSQPYKFNSYPYFNVTPRTSLYTPYSQRQSIGSSKITSSKGSSIISGGSSGDGGSSSSSSGSSSTTSSIISSGSSSSSTTTYTSYTTPPPTRPKPYSITGGKQDQSKNFSGRKFKLLNKTRLKKLF